MVKLLAETATKYMEGISAGRITLGDVPEASQSEALCLEAVRQDGQALEYAPEALHSEALCLEAVRHDCGALEYVPEALRSEALCLEAERQISKSESVC